MNIMKKTLWAVVVICAVVGVAWLLYRGTTNQPSEAILPVQNNQSAATTSTSSATNVEAVSATKTSLPSTTTAVPSLSVVSVSNNVITVRYQNMPYAGVDIVDTTGTPIWGQELGHGSGVISVSIPSGTPSGTYSLQAFSSTKTIYARSAAFTYTAEDFSKPPVIVSFTTTSMGAPGTGKYQLAWVVRNANNCQVRDSLHDLQLLADNVGNKGVFSVTTDVSTEYELYCTMSDNGKMPIYSDQKTVTIGT
jgi:hypothetical protein